MHRLKLVAALLLCAAAGFSQALPQGVREVAAIEGITEYAFPNGLEVLAFPDPSRPKVTVNITYKVGSRQEGYGETGMAHLLEHMMFLQTATRTNIKKELMDHGAVMNGSTSWDRTNYYETLAATDENLRWALELEADRMVHARIDKALLDKEMTVVRNEFEMGGNDPTRILFQRMLQTAYLWHAYGHIPVGNRSDIENVPIGRLAAFYGKYYQPDDAVLTIAGRFDGPKTLAWVAETLGRIPRPERVLEPAYTVEPVQDGERAVMLRRVGDTQAVAAMYHIPAASHPDMAAIEVLSGVLGDTPSGRLYRGLVNNKKAVEIMTLPVELHDPGVLMIMATLRQEQSLEDVRQALLDTVEGLVRDPPTQEEVERAKERLLAEVDRRIANTQSVALALSEAISVGDWRLLFYGRDELKKVTGRDVLRVAQAYLKPSNRTSGEFIPTKTPDRAKIPAAPDLAAVLRSYKGGEVIPQGEAFDPTPANIERRVARTTLANGMRLVLLSKRNRGATVNAGLGLQFGDEKSVFGKETAAQLAAGLLMRGTKNKTRQQIQAEADRLKARINITGNATSATTTIQTIEANLPGVLKLMAEILRQPGFPDTEFEQLRAQRLAALESGRSEPQTLASTALMHHLRPFSRGHARYAATIEEQIEDLKKASPPDTRRFYQQFYGASHAELVIVGQFDMAAIRKLTAELFADWRSPSRFEHVPLGYTKTEPVNRQMETPDKPNAMWTAGMNTRLAMDDPDFPAALLANRIFGGTFSSRVVHRIRDKEGLSYGITSAFIVSGKDDGAVFQVRAICAPANLPKLDALVREELARALADGFTPDEVAAEKKAWIEQLAVNRMQDDRLTATLLARERYGRTMKFDQAIEAAISALTVEQVNEAFRRHVDPGALSYFTAGDLKAGGVLQSAADQRR